MNVESPISDPTEPLVQGQKDLLTLGFSGLDEHLAKVESLNTSLARLREIGDENTSLSAQRLQDQLGDLEPSITMIGQVKAGKTSLVNAMVGWPGLLPADVNPWTSVVTSLHLNPERTEETDTSRFRFFDMNEWDRLLNKGGRIGELASRAGADEELESVRAQIEMLREKSKSRLGRKFELLLGQEHEYAYFDQDLIERYVCLGDDFEDEDEPKSDDQGRFADITKSADLFIQRPELPIKMCIRDTPGVNDTFMMREQITIRAIRDSRICVVVLSAHQALSSVDMALIRLISNIKSREVIIFVNRIDELADPGTQVPEIRNSIRETLAQHEGPSDAQIIFGSAYWANKALSDSLESLSQDSALSLFNWAEKELNCAPDATTPKEMIWHLSGLPALYRALSERIAEGVGKEAINKVARSAINLANGVHAGTQVMAGQIDVKEVGYVDREGVSVNLDEVARNCIQDLNEKYDALRENFHSRVDKSHRSFLERATASLISHLETQGEGEVWQYNPMGLRVLLRSSYQLFGTRSQTYAQKVYERAAGEISEIYARTFGQSGADFKIEPPQLGRIPPPVFLGQTIALDLQGSWWKNWWQKRRGYKAFASNFYSMIMEETDPIVEELKVKQADDIRSDAVAVLQDFIEEQRGILMDVVDKSQSDPDDHDEGPDSEEIGAREKAVETTLTDLTQHVA